MEAGQVWAYRARGQDPLTRVEVLKMGTGKPARVRVRFLDEDHEGRLEWVPPARLKVLWVDVEAWLARERRWNRVIEASYHVRDEPEEDAAIIVFEQLIDHEVAHFGFNRTAGVLLVKDLGALTTQLDLDPSDITSESFAFVDDDGVLVAPWACMEAVARRAAERNQEKLLRYVERQEEEQRQEALHGKHYRSRGGDGWYIEPEHCAETAEEFRPTYDLLREWCGTEARERFDELKALRDEVARLGQLVESALGELRQAGAAVAADRLERDLGVPIETIRRRATKDQ